MSDFIGILQQLMLINREDELFATRWRAARKLVQGVVQASNGDDITDSCSSKMQQLKASIAHEVRISGDFCFMSLHTSLHLSLP